MDERELEKRLNEWFQQVMPHHLFTGKQQRNHPAENHKNESVFETHDYIFIRIPIEDDGRVEKLKIYYGANKLMIHGLSDTEGPYSILLPAPVEKKGATAVYRDKILEIQIPKSNDWHISQIDVDKQ